MKFDVYKKINKCDITNKPEEFHEVFMKASLPLCNKKRIKTMLYYKLDEKTLKLELDKIINITEKLFDIPYVLINMVKDTKVIPLQTRNYGYQEIDRDISFCSHTILQPEEIMIIPNASKDYRFRDNPFCSSPTNIQFYVGIPISIQEPQIHEYQQGESFVMGTLCLLDVKPRNFNETDIQQLHLLADAVNDIIDKHLLKTKLKERNIMSKFIMKFIQSQKHENDENKLLLDAKEYIKNGLQNENINIEINKFDISKSIYIDDIRINNINENTTTIWESEDYSKNAIIVTFNVKIHQMKINESYMINMSTLTENRVLDIYDSIYLVQFAQAISVILQQELTNKANHTKTIFIESISHELRTPLHGILTSTELLQEDFNTTIQQKGLINLIDTSGKNLINVINKVLDFTKWESREIVIIKESNNIFDVQQEIVDSLVLSVGIECELLIDSYIPIDKQNMIIDFNIMKQILSNLVSNAIKFTTKGTIMIISYLEYKNNKINLVWNITDTGKGINIEFLNNKLFQPFEKENIFTSGIGLGLAISKYLSDITNSLLFIKKTEETVGTSVEYSIPIEIDYEKAIQSYVNKSWYFSIMVIIIHYL